MQLLVTFSKGSYSSDSDNKETVKDDRESKRMCPSVQKWVERWSLKSGGVSKTKTLTPDSTSLDSNQQFFPGSSITH